MYNVAGKAASCEGRFRSRRDDSDKASDWTNRGSNPSIGKRFFCPPKSPDRLSGPPSLTFSGYWTYFSGAKRPGHEADHSLPSSIDVKTVWSCTSAPPICLHVVDRDSITFLTQRVTQVYSNPTGVALCWRSVQYLCFSNCLPRC